MPLPRPGDACVFGMRVSELRLARIRDVNLEQGHIIVKDAKNHKDRIVPIHPALTAKCRALKESIHAGSSEDEYFFMMRPGRIPYWPWTKGP